MPNISQISTNLNMLRNVQILVVDNDFDSRYLYKTLFESYGAKVLTAESIADALALLNHVVPDILVCEIRFLDEDVWPLIQQIKAVALGHAQIIPILVVSAYCLASFAQDLIKDMEHCLLKPIDIDVLVDKVWSLVHLSDALRHTNIQEWVANHMPWENSTSWTPQTLPEKALI